MLPIFRLLLNQNSLIRSLMATHRENSSHITMPSPPPVAAKNRRTSVPSITTDDGLAGPDFGQPAKCEGCNKSGCECQVCPSSKSVPQSERNALRAKGSLGTKINKQHKVPETGSIDVITRIVTLDARMARLELQMTDIAKDLKTIMAILPRAVTHSPSTAANPYQFTI